MAIAHKFLHQAQDTGDLVNAAIEFVLSQNKQVLMRRVYQLGRQHAFEEHERKMAQAVLGQSTIKPPNRANIDERFSALLSKLSGINRIVFAGGPRSGKSTLSVRASERFRIPLRHADALVGQMEWSEASEEVARWMMEPGPWIIEGVSSARAMRKVLEMPTLGAWEWPTVVYMPFAIQVRTHGQETMAKGVETVFREIEPMLLERGVSIIEP